MCTMMGRRASNWGILCLLQMVVFLSCSKISVSKSSPNSMANTTTLVLTDATASQLSATSTATNNDELTTMQMRSAQITATITVSPNSMPTTVTNSTMIGRSAASSIQKTTTQIPASELKACVINRTTSSILIAISPSQAITFIIRWYTSDKNHTTSNNQIYGRDGGNDTYLFHPNSPLGTCLDFNIEEITSDNFIGDLNQLSDTCHAHSEQIACLVNRTTNSILLIVAPSIEIPAMFIIRWHTSDRNRTTSNNEINNFDGGTRTHLFQENAQPGTCFCFDTEKTTSTNLTGKQNWLYDTRIASSKTTACLVDRTNSSIHLNVSASTGTTTQFNIRLPTSDINLTISNNKKNIKDHNNGTYLFQENAPPGTCFDFNIEKVTSDSTDVDHHYWLNDTCYAPSEPTASIVNRTTSSILLSLWPSNGTAAHFRIRWYEIDTNQATSNSEIYIQHGGNETYLFHENAPPGTCFNFNIEAITSDNFTGEKHWLNDTCYAPSEPTASIVNRTTSSILLSLWPSNGTAADFRIRWYKSDTNQATSNSEIYIQHGGNETYLFHENAPPGTCFNFDIEAITSDNFTGEKHWLNDTCYAPAKPTSQVTNRTTTNIGIDIGFPENGTAATFKITGTSNVAAEGGNSCQNITSQNNRTHYLFNGTGIPGSCLDIVIVPFSHDGTPGANFTLAGVCYAPAQPTAHYKRTTTIIQLDIEFPGNGTAANFSITSIPTVDSDGKPTSRNISSQGKITHYVLGGIPGSCLDIEIVPFSQDGTAGVSFKFQVCYEDDHAVAIAVPVVLVTMTASTIAIVFVLKRKRMVCFKISKLREEGTNIRNKEYEMRPKANTHRPIKLSELRERVANMHKNTNMDFTSEYKDLKDIEPKHSTEAAQIQSCRSKNRYTNILSFDHSRVKLLPIEDEPGSDYINANYIQGFNGKREYIATQGPLPSTNNDFWRMVWEQKAAIIVMLTKCMENGKVKCDKYWPDVKEPIYCGELIVNVTSESFIHDYVIRVIEITLDKEIRKVFHFSYLNWPDMGCPRDPTCLINFVTTVRKYVKPKLRTPIIVHCSAGVGRTGTYIAIDYLMQFVQNHGEIDIFHLVYQLRDQRCNMVQTEDQYIFIHDSMVSFIAEDDDEDEDNHDLSPDGENIYENTGFIKD